MLRFIYRCMQRVIVFERVCVLSAPMQKVTEQFHTTNQANALSQSTLRQLVLKNEAPHCEELVEQMGDPQMHCIGVMQDERLKSFAWLYVGTAKAKMNYGDDARTATALGLAPNSAFVFHVYTSVEARGKRLMTQVLARAAAILEQELDIQYLVTTTEWTNSSARRAFRNAGFCELGFYWRCELGPWNFGIYPQPKVPVTDYKTFNS